MENGESDTSPLHPPRVRIKLNVGGKLFETTLSTLQAGGPDSLLFALSNRSSNDPTPVFIDRDPDIFSILLSILRTNRLPSSANQFSKQELADEALYYGVESCLRSATSPPPLAGIDASNVATICPATDGFASCFTADEDGSIWIAHGGQISSYDWNLAHSSTIRTHFEEITAIQRVWPEIAAVGSEYGPGVHFYDFSGGRHVGSTQWTDPSDPRIYKARVMSLADSANSVFASLECPHKENCVLEIDKSTLQTVSQIGRQLGSSAKQMAAGKLIWMPQMNTVVGTAVSCGAFGYTGYIRVWDPRSGEVVWETNEPGSGRSSRFGDSFADVDGDVEQSRLFKICSKSGDLGMADMRKLGDDPWIYLRDRNYSMRNSGDGGSSIIHCHRKQVFVGREGNLEVWSRVDEGAGGESGEEEEETEKDRMYRRNYVDKLEDAERGVIRKIEGGGDRLFVGRENVEGIEVWQSSHVAAAFSVL